MSAYNCGCDPEAKWKCRDFPDCAGARVERERKIELVETLMKNGFEAIRARELELMDELQAGKWEGVMPVRDVPEMSLNDYQRSLHTYKDRHQECHALGLVGELAEVQDELKKDPKWLSVDRDVIRDVLIAAGRVADMVKKATAHGVPLDPAKLKKELGDVLWYITAVASDNALTLEEIAKANVEKLQQRYPNGFRKGGGVRNERTLDMPVPKFAVPSVNLRTEMQPASPSLTPRANAVHFGCGCSETVVDGITTRSYCPNGECRRLTR